MSTPAGAEPRPADVALAVDVGGTKMAAGLVTADGELVVSNQIPTTRGVDADDLFGSLGQLVDGVLASGVSAGVAAPVLCGVGCGGPMTDRGALVSPINIAAWRAFPLRERLHDHTGLVVHLDNDAKALAIGEGWRGAASGRRNYLGMVVSTGVGGGIVLDGRLLDGADGNAGHIGHITVEPMGHECGCGARGCLEAEASGTAIEKITGRSAIEASPETIERTGVLVGRAIASVANLLDLTLAVVAGSVALGFGTPFFAAAQREIDQRARLDFTRGAMVVPGGLGPAGPLIGAAAVGWRGEGRDIGIG